VIDPGSLRSSVAFCNFLLFFGVQGVVSIGSEINIGTDSTSKCWIALSGLNGTKLAFLNLNLIFFSIKACRCISK
jgi:hypothetical protein